MTIDGRSVTGASAGFRRALAIGQVAVAVFLLCGAGLLLRTLLVLQGVDSGTRARDVLTMVISVSAQGEDTPESTWRRYEDFRREVESVPGVRAVAWGSALPLDGSWYGQSFAIEGDPPRQGRDGYSTGYQLVSSSYLSILGIPLREGRGFLESDDSDSPQVCLVDEEFVRRFLHGRPALGARIAMNAASLPPATILSREIVGVVAQVKERPDEAEPRPHVYAPFAQDPLGYATLVVEPTDGPAAALSVRVRSALARVDRNRPAGRVRTLTAVSSEATARPRFRALLIGTFSLLALMLAMVGVFGVLAYSVQQRTREFGVRIALGASGRNVLGLVLGNASRVVGTGVVIGLVLALVFAQSVASFLFGVAPRDPVTFVSVGAVLVVTAMMACAVPALRAVRVDPVEAFRNE